MPSTVIVFRVHSWSLALARRFSRLANESREVAAVYVLIDTTPGSPVELKWRRLCERVGAQVETFQLSKLAAILGYPPMAPPRVVPGSCDFPMTRFAQRHDFEHYWATEGDIEFTGDWGELVRRLAHHRADLIVTNDYRTRQQHPQWFYWSEFCTPGLDESHHLHAEMQLFRATREALLAAHAARSEGWRGHHESLIPTANATAGRVVQQLDVACHEVGWSEFQSVVTWDFERTRADRSTAVRRPTLLHPVKKPWVYDGARWIFVPAPRDLPRYLGQWRPPVGRRTRAALGKIKRRILR